MGEINKTTVLDALSHHVGGANGITGYGLTSEILGGAVEQSDERHLRKVIQSLREDGSHICGRPGQGYFMAENEDDLNETCLYLYGRCMTGLQQISAMKRVSTPDFLGQLRLPTT